MSVDLCTLSDVRLALSLQVSETGRDTDISAKITDASTAIIAYTERELAPATPAATRTFPVWLNQNRQGVRVDLAPYDLRTATTVTLNPETSSPTVLTANTDYTLRPLPSTTGTYQTLWLSPRLVFYSQLAIFFGYAQLSVLGDWGFATVPADVKRACIVTVTSWMDKPVATYGAQEMDSGGRVMVPDTAGGLSLPNAAKRLLEPYRRLSAL